MLTTTTTRESQFSTESLTASIYEYGGNLIQFTFGAEAEVS